MRFRAETARKYAAYGSATAVPRETADYYRKALRGVVRFTPDERVLHWDNAKLSRG